MMDVQTHGESRQESTGATGTLVQGQLPAALTEQLDALAELSANALRKQWCVLFKTQPPKRMTRNLLLLAVAWKMQTRALGGLSTTVKRKLQSIAGKSDAQSKTAMRGSIRLKPGTKLIREWHGDVHEVLVRESGFEWQGQHYRSLSNVASQITGAHWSGPRFFGLNSKPDNFARTEAANDA